MVFPVVIVGSVSGLLDLGLLWVVIFRQPSLERPAQAADRRLPPPRL